MSTSNSVSVIQGKITQYGKLIYYNPWQKKSGNRQYNGSLINLENVLLRTDDCNEILCDKYSMWFSAHTCKKDQ